MITVRSTINLAHQSVPNVIPAVQGDTGRSILFTLADFTIPAGATARYFITKPSGLAVYNDATIDGNTVLVDLTAQSLAEYGDCPGQVRIMLGQTVVTSFEFILHVEPFRGIDAVESTTETNIFDKAVEDAREAIAEAAEDAEEYISQAIDPTLTIPDKAADAKATGDAISDSADAVIAQMRAEIANVYPTETAQGNPATFDDGADNIPVKDLKVSIVPTQDLHGYDKPWAGGAGKNKLPNLGNATSTENGITFTKQADGSVNANGTATATATYRLINTSDAFVIPAGTYILTGAKNSNQSIGYKFVGEEIEYETGSGKTITLSASKTVDYIFVRIGSGQALSNVVFYPMLRLSSESDATWQPYSNLCPITGMTEVEVERTGKNLAISQSNNSVIGYAKKGKTYTVSFKPGSSTTGANVYKNSSSGASVATGGMPLTFTADEDFSVYFNAWSANFTELQLEYGSTATDYVPYVTPQTVTTDLGRTVYGGTLDVTSGVLTVDRAYCKLTSSDLWTYTDICITNAFTGGKYADATTQSQKTGVISNAFMTSSWAAKEDMSVFMYYGQARYCLKNSQLTSLAAWQSYVTDNDVEIVYELATPQTYQLTPQELTTILGTNHIRTDAESVEVVYRQDIGLILKRMSDSLLPYLPLTRDGIYDLKAEVTGGEKSLYWWTQAFSMMSSARPMQTPIADEPEEELEEVEEVTPEEDEED